MTGRREDVLTVLRAAPNPLSIADVAEQLSIHPNTARFHLETLVDTGRAETADAASAKPGRPPLMFRAVPGMDPRGRRDYRMLADILTEEYARQANPARRAVTAGRRWGEHVAPPGRARGRRQAIDRLTGLLTDLGFAPDARNVATGEIGLRNCPFLDLAVDRQEVVCPVHLGLMQGALESWGAPVTVDELTPFVEPGLCVAHLSATRKTP